MDESSRRAGNVPPPESADEGWMRAAIREAEKGAAAGEVPIGAVVVSPEGKILARAHNRPVTSCDPTAHAEILVLRKGGKVLGNYRLNNTVLYVTAEPCPMCLSAMMHGRVSRLVFGAPEPKFGAVESKFGLLKEEGFNHRIEVEHGVLEQECIETLQGFFRKRRQERTSWEFGVGSAE